MLLQIRESLAVQRVAMPLLTGDWLRRGHRCDAARLKPPVFSFDNWLLRTECRHTIDPNASKEVDPRLVNRIVPEKSIGST